MQNPSYQQLRNDFLKVQEGLRKLIATGHLAQAGQILNMISLKSFEFDLSTVKSMPVEDLMVFLTHHRQLNHFQLSILAGLLTLDGEIYFQRKAFMDSLLAVERSLKILLFLDNEPENSTEMPDLPQRITVALEFHQMVRSALSQS